MLRPQLIPSIVAKTTAVLIPLIVITVGDAYKNGLLAEYLSLKSLNRLSHNFQCVI